MKFRILTIALLALGLFSCNKTSFNVNVNLQNANGKMVYLQKSLNGESIVIDSATINNDQANFVVENDNPTIYYSLKIKDVRYPISFFSENKNVTIVGDINDTKSISIIGSQAQQLLNEYNDEINKYNQQFRELRQQYEVASKSNDEATLKIIEDNYNTIEKNQNNYISLFMTKNSNSFIAPFILYRNRYNYELKELVDFVNNFNINIDNDHSKRINDYISVLQRVDIGQTYLDFTQETPDGYTLSLSELVGKSKLLLIDFWASWCGPCRAENPNVVEVYNEYHEKGFDVLGVSLDMTKENWIKAIEDDGLIWHNISDLKYWNNEAAQMYGISSIPSNLLLDENGVIIAKNLRGNDLKNKVKEYLK